MRTPWRVEVFVDAKWTTEGGNHRSLKGIHLANAAVERVRRRQRRQ